MRLKWKWKWNIKYPFRNNLSSEEIPTFNFHSFPLRITFQVVVATEKKKSRVYLDMNSFFFIANSTEEDMRIFFEWLNDDHSLHHLLFNLALCKKARLSLLLLVFTLIRFWFRKGSLYGLFAFWYLIECFIFSLFIIDYLNIIFLTCWYIFISFFSFEYFSFITLCSFRCVLISDFHFLFRIEERV